MKSDAPNEEEVKRAAELREWIETRVQELETELERLKDMRLVVDSMLRKSSFVPAAELKVKEKPAHLEKPTSQDVEEPKQLRRAKDGLLIASAFLSPDKLVVIPSSDVKVSQTTPPFQTFFINRILKGYQSKDQELVTSGKMKQSEVLSFEVGEKDGVIAKVTIRNYGDNMRLNEILSTINWAFTRMLEKK